MDQSIRIKNLSKSYQLFARRADRVKEMIHPFGKKYHRDFYALKNIDLEVGRGEVLGIVGRNGSGKSTLLKIITGITTATSGTVDVDGKISALIELGAGFDTEYTGLENIYLNGAILGYSPKEIELKLDEILAFADIGDYIHQPVKTYSSGMLVRLAFSLAVTVDPDILVVDEALSVGDALFQRKCFAKIDSFIERGKTVIFVSHSLDTVTELCHRVLIMDAGEIILDTKPKLARNYYFKLLYSPKEEYRTVREEIVRINEDAETKRRLEAEEKEAEDERSSDPVDFADVKKPRRDFYIADLTSPSRVETQLHDLEVFDVCLKDPDGENVNHITMNNLYIYSYKVRFNEPAQKINFDLAFRTTTGVTVCRALAPGKYPFDYIEQVKAGEVFQVDWRFKCNLLAGTYFTNVLVWGSVKGGERGFLIRVADALLFKVQDAPHSPYDGLVHLEQHAEIKRI